MNKIHLIGGEKGGVGKSLVARVVAQYLIDKNIPFLGFDTDRSHGSLLRFYTDFASPVVVDNYESLDAIVEAAAEQPDKRVLVDLAAQTHEPLVKWMDDSGVLETAAELELSFCYWHVMDSGKDSVDLLTKLVDRFGERLNYVPRFEPIARRQLRHLQPVRRARTRERTQGPRHHAQAPARTGDQPKLTPAARASGRRRIGANRKSTGLGCWNASE